MRDMRRGKRREDWDEEKDRKDRGWVACPYLSRFQRVFKNVFPKISIFLKPWHRLNILKLEIQKLP